MSGSWNAPADATAEVQRLTRALAVAPERRDDLVAAITAKALWGDSLQISPPDLNPAPDAFAAP